MSNKRFWWSVAAVWVCLFLTNWAFHGVWLQPLYKQTAQFWRPMDQMKGLVHFMWLGNLIFAWAFVWVYAQGVSKANQWHQAFRYGLAVLLLAKLPHLLETWVVSPFPTELIWKWFVVSAAQAWLCAYVMTWTFKPLKWLRSH